MLLDVAPAGPPSDGSSAFGKGFLPGYGTAFTLRSLADQYSQPSDIWSLSVSARHGSVPIESSRLFGRRSPSWSELSLQTAGVPPPPPPPPPPSPSPTAVMTGESRREVNLLNWPLSTRSFMRVGRCLLFATRRRRATAAGTRTTSFLVVARRGLANAVRPSGPRKMIVFLSRRALKCEPVIVTRLPTLTRMGWTRVIVGAGPFAANAVGTTARRAASASRQMVRRRRMLIPLSTVRVVS